MKVENDHSKEFFRDIAELQVNELLGGHWGRDVWRKFIGQLRASVKGARRSGCIKIPCSRGVSRRGGPPNILTFKLNQNKSSDD